MERQLASIQKITNIKKIEGADKIECAEILSWELVIGKNDNLKIGDFVVYFQIDSILPEKPEFDFLKERKYRVKTAKFRKQISQGLAMPLSILPNKKWKEGDDVTSVLGVKKYDPQADLEQKMMDDYNKRKKSKISAFMGKYKWYRRLFFAKKERGFPKFIKKTDEDRIQLFPDICTREKDTFFSVTEKLDGQSGTYFLIRQPKFTFLKWNFGKKYVFGVCSRNFYLRKPNQTSYWTIAKQCNIENVLRQLIEDNELIVLQGEIIGDGIQGNRYRINGYDFYAFNLIIENKLIDSSKAKDILKSHGIKFVPILEEYYKLKPRIADNVEYANGRSVLLDVKREGIVLRNNEKNISFKIVSPKFLLENEE